MAVGARPPGDYAPAAGARALEALTAAAEPLRGARILHVSPAGTAGRVPDLLGSMLPLAAGSGIEVGWRVLFGTPEERAAAAALQSGLRGAESAIEPEAWERFADGCERAARDLANGWDVVVLHDSALALAAGIETPTVWRAHDDMARAEADAVELIRALHERCRLMLVPHDSFAPPALRDGRLVTAAPGIDPLDPRNIELETRLPGRVVRPLGVDLERPFCLQVLELDRWDDPHAAIDAFSLSPTPTTRVRATSARLPAAVALVALREVEIKRQTPLHAVLKPAVISESQFFEWNPALEPKVKFLPVGYRVKLTPDKVDDFLAAQRRALTAPPVKKVAVAKAGGTKSTLASQKNAKVANKTAARSTLKAKPARKRNLISTQVNFLPPS